jgi:DNA mismatch repair protein MutL
MRPIVKLSPEVIGKIAAGEVVERPAAAIKEMVENSMDAGASAVTIEIRDGGITYIRVTDNGSGIPQPQIRMAFERHATSKIITSEDLHHIETLGFRGEALASIAAVSRVTCTTRVKGEDCGIAVVNEGGVIQEIRGAACPEGTTFIVRDLFYNTPVRLKFLKKPAAEAAFVSDLVMRLILSNPAISFRLISQGKTVYHSPGDGKLESAVYSIYGKEMLKSMRFVTGGSRGLWLEGFVGIGDSARGTRSNQSFFINGRYMKSVLLAQALEQGCRERVTIGHFPTCVLHLKMALEAVDVNVHPNKMEVRFQNENDIFEAVRDMILDVLGKDDPLDNVPEMELNPVQPAPHLNTNKVAVMSTVAGKTDYGTVSSGDARDEKPSEDTGPKFNTDISKLEPRSNPAISLQSPVVVTVPSREPSPVLRETYMPASIKPLFSPNQKEAPAGFNPPAAHEAKIPEKAETIPAVAEKELRPDIKILGVVFQTYVLIEYKDQLLLIDQHAAHERLLFDRMIKAYDQKAASQALLVPQVVTLTHRELETLQENQEALNQTGFEISSFGDHAVQIRSVPIILGQPQAKSFLLELLDELETMRGLTTLEKRRTAVLQMACKRAVKGGERLPQVEIEDIVLRATETGVTPTCPHGRPLVVSITHQDLDKRFKRIQ